MILSNITFPESHVVPSMAPTPKVYQQLLRVEFFLQCIAVQILEYEFFYFKLNYHKPNKYTKRKIVSSVFGAPPILKFKYFLLKEFERCYVYIFREFMCQYFLVDFLVDKENNLE